MGEVWHNVQTPLTAPNSLPCGAHNCCKCTKYTFFSRASSTCALLYNLGSCLIVFVNFVCCDLIAQVVRVQIIHTETCRKIDGDDDDDDRISQIASCIETTTDQQDYLHVITAF